MDHLRLCSPSKINLHLRIGSPGADGFHPLRSWMVSTSLCDFLRFERTGTDGITLSCTDSLLPTGLEKPFAGPTNLVTRAAEALLQCVEASERIGLKIELDKRTPIGAGLGGGSGNAAATLHAMNHFLGNRFSVDSLSEIAATLGSDVPFFLGSPSAIATGRGEGLAPAPVPAANIALLFLPAFPIPTAHAYRVLDELRPKADEGTLDAFDVLDWAGLPPEGLLARLINDLEPAAFKIEPRLGKLRDSIESKLGRIVRMSGSGSALFTLFDENEPFQRAAQTVEKTLGIRVERVRIGISRLGEPPA